MTNWSTLSPSETIDGIRRKVSTELDSGSSGSGGATIVVGGGGAASLSSIFELDHTNSA